MDKSYRAVGLMSGTSLDGLDIALCTFNLRQSIWSFSVDRSSTIPYSSEWKKRLIEAPDLNGYSLIQLHKNFGKFLGESINDFLKVDQTNIDLIASHGHTIFHVPEKKMTFQLGDGNSIAAETNQTIVSDFRSMDVALGGQGAPLVPIGDEYLFGSYDFCLNLGGFSNISYNKDRIRVAYDSSPANIILNFLMNSLGKEYDKDGETGRKGNFNKQLFEELNKLEYYNVLPPKSLGKE